jgi:putative peptidoglycan lipid II flippase
LPFLRQLDRLPSPRWDTQHEGVKKIALLMVPAIFGVSVSQINLLLDTVLASFLPTGSVSWLYYSDRLVELPLGVFGIAIATVILPSLSRLQLQNIPIPSDADGSEQGHFLASATQFRDTLEWALRAITIVAIPATAALWLLATPILFTLFQYQAMTPADVGMAAVSLQAYSLGLMAFMAIKVLATGFFARQDMKTPVKVGIIAMVANMVFNLIFVYLLHYHYQLGHVGLALATSLSAWLNAALLYRGLMKNDVLLMSANLDKPVRLLSEDYWRLLLKITLAVGFMLFVLSQLLPTEQLWLTADWLTRSAYLAVIIISGFISYCIVLWLTGVRIADFRPPAVVERGD